MAYQLNHQALERLRALVRAGNYVDRAWTFSADDSNALLGDDNWAEYAQWFLGIDNAAAEKTKEKYAYPFGKGSDVYLSALRAIASRASAEGAGDIAKAASDVLAEANQKDQDKAEAAAVDVDRDFALTAPVSIQAAADSADALPTFDMTAYTGGPMRLKGWQYPVVVDLNGIGGIDKARPILRDHDQGKIVGHADAGQIQVRDGKLVAAGTISGHGPHADEVVQTGLKKFPWQASIGAKVLKNQFVPEGDTVDVNGRTFEGPVNVARRTSLGEISFVALGADDNTSARIAAHAAKGSVMTFEQWLESKGIAADGLSDAVRNTLKASFDAEQNAIAAAAGDAKCDDDDMDADDDEDDEDDSDADKDPPKKAKAKKEAKAASVGLDIEAMTEQSVKAIRAANAKEMKRSAKVREIAAGHDAIATQAVAEGWDETKTELAVLRAERTGKTATASSFGINTGKGSKVTPDIIAASAALASGVREKSALSGLTDNEKEIAASGKVRKQVGSIYGLCAVIAASQGSRLPSPRMDEDVIKHMFRLDKRTIEAMDMDITADGGGTGGYSTMSLSGITENILNKAMLDAYGNIPSVVPDICYETDTNDFKTFKRYRLTSSGILSALGAAGELKAITLQDESYSNAVKTQGVILTVGRDILINDDLGALTQAPTLLGRGSALYREMVVFGNLLAGATTTAPGASTGQTANGFNFFSAGAANFMTGGTSALAISALTTAVQKFREQVDANSMPIMLNPDRLLLPPALEVTGKNLFNGAELVVGALGSTSSKSVEPNINAHKGAYRPIVSPFLSATVAAKIAKLKGDPIFSNFSAASDTAWYLLTNPAGGFATTQIGYLRGQRTPIIERGEANFNTLGIAMRCYYDFGVALHDYRCGVLSAGA